MTRKTASGDPPEAPEADPVEEAIRKLQALKKKREAGGAAAPEPNAVPPTRKQRGRPPKTPEQVSATERPSLGVSRPTAHRPLGLLEAQDKTDLDALMADPRLAPHIALRLDERFALVLPAHQERLQAALLKAGHTPRLSGPSGRREPGHREPERRDAP